MYSAVRNGEQSAALAGYIGRAIEQHGVPVLSSVIYLRPDAGRRDPGVRSGGVR